MLYADNVIDFPDNGSMEAQDYSHLEADLKNGYAPIANDYLKALGRARLSQRQRQVIDAVMFHTYGQKDYEASKDSGKYQSKKTARIKSSDLADFTGLTEQSASKILNELIGMNIVIRVGSSRGEVGMNDKISDWILPDFKASKAHKISCQKSRDNQKTRNGSLNHKMVNSHNHFMVSSEAPIKNIDTKDTFFMSGCDQPEVQNFVDEYIHDGLDCTHPLKPKKLEQRDAKKKPWAKRTQRQKVQTVFDCYNEKFNTKFEGISSVTSEYTTHGIGCLDVIKQGYSLRHFKLLFGYKEEMAKHAKRNYDKDFWSNVPITALVRKTQFSGYFDTARSYYVSKGDIPEDWA